MHARLSFLLPGFVGALCAMSVAGPARAEIIELVDKTKMVGKIIHYYEGVYSVESQGSTVKIPREKIRSISFDLPKARPEFATPEKTFERFRKASEAGDLEKVIDCYALMFQGVLASQVGQTPDAAKKMQKEYEGRKFVIKGTQIKGDRATLSVQMSQGDNSMTNDVVLGRENGEWKMLPPQ